MDKEEQMGLLRDELFAKKFDVEQVVLFGIERADFEEKKARCKQIVLELKELEKRI